MNKLIGLIITTLVCISCNQESKKQEVVSMEDFAGKTGVIDFDEEVIIDTTIRNEISTALDKFIILQNNQYDTTSSDDFHPLDRFSFNTSTKINFRGKNEVPYGKNSKVTPNSTLFYYTFSDTSKTKNALYNWLDCFGNDCNKVKLNEEVKSIKTTPIFSVVYDTTIVVVNYKCEDQKNDWKSFEKELINQFGKNYAYRFKVGCGGPLKWE